MKKFRFLLISFFLAATLSAQTSKWQIVGRISNQSGEYLPGATIFIEGEMKKVSDADGQFEYSDERKPNALNIRLLGYRPYHVLLDTLRWGNRKLNLKVVLQPIDSALQEVVISAAPMKVVFKEHYAMDLLDYELLDNDLLLLLLKTKRKTLLQLTTEEGLVLSELSLSKGNSPSFLHQSCTGNYHIIGPYWAWELDVKSRKVDTLGRYTSAEYYTFIERCTAYLNGYYFFRKTENFGQSIQYIWIGPTGETRQLAYILDQVVLDKVGQLLLEFRNNEGFMAPRPYELDPSGSFLTDPVEHYLERVLEAYDQAESVGLKSMRYYSNDQMAQLSTLELTRSDSLFAPMFVIGDSIYLFNHPQKTLWRFRPNPSFTGSKFEVQKTPLTYHLEKKWGKSILVDNQLHRAYGRFQSANKGLVLKEIDFETGLAQKTYLVTVAPFLSEKHRIRNGALYFIGQPDVTIPNQMLYKVDLHQFKL